ncbi:MAG: YraN family protein [Syntrophorhabdus sp.]
MSDKKLIGAEGEDRAASILKKEGYKILSKNFRSPFGEIDIIAEDKDYLVFIEVKRRKGNNFGTSLEAINSRKKLHIIRSAQMYLKANHCLGRRIRFDVVGIDGDNVKVIKHAFGDDR